MIRATAVLAVALLAGCAAPEPSGRRLVVLAGTLIDGTGAPPRRDVAVVLRDGVIESVGGPVPAGIETIDARDATVLPGLIDGHVHGCLSGGGWMLAAERLDSMTKAALALHAGVTTLVSMGDGGGWAWRFGSPGPGTGRMLIGRGGHPSEIIGMERAFSVVEAGREPVRFSERDLVKVVNDGSLPEGSLKKVVAAAHAAKARVFVHVGTKAQAIEALSAGADGIEHLPVDMDDEVIRKLVETRAIWTPTLADAAMRLRARDVNLAYFRRTDVVWHVPPAVRLSAELAVGAGKAGAFDLSWILKAHRAGVRIAAGSDAGAPGVFFGPGLILEIELLVEAGLTPVEAIHAATGRSAERIGLANEGRIAPGFHANLVIVPGDASRDITALRMPRLVSRNGRFQKVVDAADVAGPERILLGADVTMESEHETTRIQGTSTGWAQLVVDRKVAGAKGVRCRIEGRAPPLRLQVGTTATGNFRFPGVPVEPGGEVTLMFADLGIDAASVLTVRLTIEGEGEVDLLVSGVAPVR